ncbi:MAG: hypothetical protein AB8B67_01170 [Rickettsiaceae bacterium]
MTIRRNEKGVYNIFSFIGNIVNVFHILIRQLYLSLTSPNFYWDVLRVYRGRGIKYLATISFIAVLIYSLFIMMDLIMFKKNFDNDKSGTFVEQIIDQLPEMYYNGKIISAKNLSEPKIILDSNGNKIIAIDLNNKMNYSEKSSIPLTLTSSNLLISLNINDRHRNITIEYPKLLGNQPELLSKDNIHKILNEKVFAALDIGIWVFALLTPFMCIVQMSNIVFSSNFLVMFALIYICNYVYRSYNLSLSKSQLIMLAISIVLLLKPILEYILIKQFYIIILVLLMLSMRFMRKYQHYTMLEFNSVLRLVIFANGAIFLLKPILDYLTPNGSYIITTLLEIRIYYLLLLGLFSNTQNVSIMKK